LLNPCECRGLAGQFSDSDGPGAFKMGLSYGAEGPRTGCILEKRPAGVFIASSCAVHVSGHTGRRPDPERPVSCLRDELLFLAAELLAEFFELLLVKFTPGAGEPSTFLFPNVVIDEFA
jgi:hypothetical protein